MAPRDSCQPVISGVNLIMQLKNFFRLFQFLRFCMDRRLHSKDCLPYNLTYV